MEILHTINACIMAWGLGYSLSKGIRTKDTTYLLVAALLAVALIIYLK